MKYNYGSYKKKFDDTTQWYIEIRSTGAKLCEMSGDYNTEHCAKTLTARLNDFEEVSNI